jgi:hypothetical protein
VTFAELRRFQEPVLGAGGVSPAPPVSQKISDAREIMTVVSAAPTTDMLAERSRSTPRSTIEAVLYCVRERGLAALREPTNLERLSQCDGKARAQINERIAKLEKGSSQ